MRAPDPGRVFAAEKVTTSLYATPEGRRRVERMERRYRAAQTPLTRLVADRFAQALEDAIVGGR